MTFSLKNRHLYGAGAAACAACCAAPILAVLGIAGAAATIATFVFAGATFALVVATGAALTYWIQRRRTRETVCQTQPTGPVDVELTGKNSRPLL